jgi:Tol biopolymer transport system component
MLTSGCAWIVRAAQNPSEGANPYRSVALSADGRFVAFATDVALDPSDSDQDADVYVRDQQDGAVTLVSTDDAPSTANGSPSISGSGRYVAYEGFVGPRLRRNIFVRDRHLGTTTQVTPDGGASPSISSDGRYIAFSSSASDLVPGDTNGLGDVFVADLVAKTIVRASVDGDGADANGSSYGASISGDGLSVAFESSASDLVANDTNGVTDVFVRRLDTGVTVRASVDSSGNQVRDQSLDPSISGDGRYVAFESADRDLADNDLNGTFDVFRRDLQSGATELVSVNSAGNSGNGVSEAPSISGDGGEVAFQSSATDLAPGVNHHLYRHVYVRDVSAGLTTRASADTFDRPAYSGDSRYAALSFDGRFVAFVSDALGLVSDDAGFTRDVFVRATRSPSITSLEPSTVARGATSTVTVTGRQFASGTTVNIDPPTGLTVQTVTVLSDTKLEVVVAVVPDAPVGPRQFAIHVPAPGPGAIGIAESIAACNSCIAVN